ncbi:DUF3805 domain-containing protein [Lottiidibacillus patelloidae]|uniref:DUF3805 domain-containing protein n=1 Tax=Lottiidibacillus patelloidae TaxID=2670334 RepID=UPI0013037779
MHWEGEYEDHWFNYTNHHWIYGDNHVINSITCINATFTNYRSNSIKINETVIKRLFRRMVC